MDIYYLEYDGGKMDPLYFETLDKLFSENGINIQYNMKRAPKELAKIIEDVEHQQNLFSICQVSSLIKDTLGCIPKNSAMIVFSRHNRKLNELFLKENRFAHWGGKTDFGENQDFSFASAYPPEESPNHLKVQIHETLHLFGVDDCYGVNTNSKVECDNPKCLMRYEVPSLEICGNVKKQLLTFIEK